MKVNGICRPVYWMLFNGKQDTHTKPTNKNKIKCKSLSNGEVCSPHFLKILSLRMIYTQNTSFPCWNVLIFGELT